MARRITISRGDIVKLRGVKTRFKAWCMFYGHWRVARGSALVWVGKDQKSVRAYLEALTDEELMA